MIMFFCSFAILQGKFYGLFLNASVARIFLFYWDIAATTLASKCIDIKHYSIKFH